MYRDMIDVREAVPHYFSRSTMRFFRAKVESGLLYGRFFVTSEQFNDASPRLYSVREIVGKNIRTVGEFQGHHSKASAKYAAECAALETLPELQPA